MQRTLQAHGRRRIETWQGRLTLVLRSAMVNRVVNNREIDDAFAALGDPTRRRIVERLARREQTVGELASGFAMSPPAISKHVKVLERCGLLRRRIVGREHHCRLGVRKLTMLSTWIARQERYWNGALDRLTANVERDVTNTDRKDL
jgi:DNA-binding transcriptional ArsR family regulator